MEREWSRPKLVVSSCLNKEKCRYDGTDSPCKTLDELSEFIDIIPVCPELSIGLKVPRDSIRCVGSLEEYKIVDPKSDLDLTDKMLDFTSNYIESVKREDITGFLLKGRSPSCGIKDVKIYNTKEKGSMSVKGQGLFAKNIIKNFEGYIVEEEGRLKSFEIRDNFLIKIFTLANFDTIKKKKNIFLLIEYHSKNKLLFKTFSQDITSKMGNLVANKDKKLISLILDEYEMFLRSLLSKNQKFKRCIYAFEKAYGYISKQLYDDEKNFFKETLEEYKIGKQAKKSIITLLKSYAVRFDNEYLLSQTLLEPYPEKLLNLDDSGKGIAR